MKRIYFFLIAMVISVSAFSQVWRAQSLGYGTKTLGMRDISIVNANTVWVTSYDGFQPFVVNTLDFSRTINGGTTWVPGRIGRDTNLVTSSIVGISATEAWVSGYKNSGGGSILHTTDGGINWVRSGPDTMFGATSFPNFVTFRDSLSGLTMGDPVGGYLEIYKTLNRGNLWTRTPAANLPALLSNEFGTPTFAVNKNSIWFGSSRGRIYYTSNFGNSWAVTTVFTQTDRFFNRIAFRDSLNGLCIAVDNTRNYLYSTNNGGATWTEIPVITNLRAGSLCAIPGTNIYLSTAQSVSPFWGTSISKDDGRTWITLEALDNRGTVAFFNNTTGWSGGFSGPGQAGGIFKYNGNPVATLEENLAIESLETYPNPVLNTLNIEITTKELVSKLIFTVFDAAGQAVLSTTKVPDATKISARLDFSQLKNGVYFLSVYNGKTRLTRGVVKAN
jgi:photosystem II stability/assembly factor-like uncharacterized protein